ncbi:MAG: DUF3375 domain-containing protein [Deltaproteobacteria bacterium]|jgi:hypothetical protein|nr:DUF3375 domain-containing protein [Deltaproteobacteria bacterium]
MTDRLIRGYGLLREHSPAWRLLNATNGPAILALLKTHLYDNLDERVLRSSVLCERVRADLDKVREDPADYPRPAEEYVDEWVDRRFLMRELKEGDDEERLWLSAASIDAIRFVEGLANPRSTVTESRLSILIQALDRLSVEADRNSTRRLEHLLEERDELDREIEALRRGNVKVISDVEALERVREIIALGTALAEDFSRVEEEHKDIHRKLRENILESSGNLKDVLDQVFHDLNHLQETEAGRSFQAFYRLLTDQSQQFSLERSLDVVRQSEFFRELSLSERTFLKRFVDVLFRQSVNLDKITERFSASLLSLLQSREFKERRRVSELIDETQKLAGRLSSVVGMTKSLNFHIQLTLSDINSVSRLSLADYYPSGAPVPVVRADSPKIDAAELLSSILSDEIDFDSLILDILDVLELLPRCSIGDVLYHHPATEGLGSVVGLMHLAQRCGEMEEATETVSWVGLDETRRSASIDKWYFSRERAHELSL